jgi:competence protein ComEC
LPAPIVWIGAAWLVGTVAAHHLPELPSAQWCAPLLLAALAALRCAFLRPVLVAAAAAAWTCWFAADRLAERLPLTALGTDFALTGTVAGFPSEAPGQTTFAFEVAEPRRGVPSRVRLTWYDPPAGIGPGEELAVTARLRPPRGARNPGGFDYEQWLLVNGYGATGYVRSGTVGADGADGADGAAFETRWRRFRGVLAERIGAASSDVDGVALLTALALGERFRFTEQHWADFRRTGTSHLVAVSGMHVALLGIVVFALVRWAWLRLPAPLASFDLEAAAAASLLATAYYAALTGFAVPAQRSLVMVAVALAALASRRRFSAAQIVAATLVVVLVFDPFAPLSASFWLSFVAVAILLALAAPRSLARARASRAVRGMRVVLEFARLQWWIGFALLPLTAWYFGEVSVVGPFVNLVAIPFFNACLVPLAVLVTLGLSVDAAASSLAPVVHGVASLAGMTVRTLHVVAELRGAALAWPLPPAFAFAVGALGVVTAILGSGLPGHRCGWLALLPIALPVLDLPPPGTARAVVLDVGHGLAVLVETRAHRLLFDAGPTARSGFDSGEEIVLPALAAGGRRGLDRLVVSHADNDHAGGAPAIVAAFPGVEVLKGPDVAALKGRTCARGDEWEWDGVRFTILHPREGFAARGNDSSCVLKVEAGASALLVTGDIEQRGENALRGEALAADVVVVPHHGSATSSSQPFVAAVGAKLAIVSAAYANRWGFPRPEVRERWQRSGAAVVVTGDAGAVSVELGPAGVAVAAEREARHRYWHAPRFLW